MRVRLTPTARLSFGLTAFAVTLGLVAYSLGLGPNLEQTNTNARASIAEALASPIAALLERNDTETLRETIESAVARRGWLSMIRVVGPGGETVAQAGDESAASSAENRLDVNLAQGDVSDGSIVFVFRPSTAEGLLWGFSLRTLAEFAILIIAAYAGFYSYLRRALRVLIPEDAVPDRVEAAFDTLAEGVLIVDSQWLYSSRRTIGVCPTISFQRQIAGRVKDRRTSWRSSGSGRQRRVCPGDCRPETIPNPVIGLPWPSSSGPAACDGWSSTRRASSARAGPFRASIVTFDDLTESITRRGTEPLHQQLKAFQSTIERKTHRLTVARRRGTPDQLPEPSGVFR